MLKKALLIATLLIFASAGMALACNNCFPIAKTEGFHKQQSSAFIDKATIKKGNIVNGAQAVAEQKTAGSYKAPYGGIGATGGIGIATTTVTNSKKTAYSAGLAANLSASGVLGFRSCAKLEGAGKVQTVAVKGGGAAMSSGGYKYSGQVGNGVVIGAGITAGFSKVTASGNTVTATAGHVTASGIGTIGGLR